MRIRVDEQVRHHPDVAAAQVRSRADADDATVELGDTQAHVAEDVLQVRIAQVGHVRPADALVVRLHDPGELVEVVRAPGADHDASPGVHRPAARITSTRRSCGSAWAVMPSRPTTVGAATSALTMASSVASMTASKSRSMMMSPTARTS